MGFAPRPPAAAEAGRIVRIWSGTTELSTFVFATGRFRWRCQIRRPSSVTTTAAAVGAADGCCVRASPS